MENYSFVFIDVYADKTLHGSFYLFTLAPIAYAHKFRDVLILLKWKPFF